MKLGVIMRSVSSSIKDESAIKTMKYVKRSSQHYAVDKNDIAKLLGMRLGGKETITVNIGVDNCIVISG